MKYVHHALSALLAMLLMASSIDSIAKPQIRDPEALLTNPIKPDNAPAVTKPVGRVWNLQDADILSVINEVSLETGKNFVVDPRVSGKISLISSKPLKPSEVYQVFLSVLELLGYSAIPTDNIVKVVPNMESSEMATRVASNKSPGKGDEVVVRIIPLENVSAAQLLPVLRPMLPQWGNISVYAPGNTLIILGRAANLQRIMEVIKNVDVAASSNIDVIPLHQASASQVAAVLANLQNTARANGDSATLSIAADERSNRILLSGNKAARTRMKTLIAELDAPVVGSQGNTEVVYLRYLQAKMLAPVLGKIAHNISHSGTSDTSATPAAASASTTSSSNTSSGTKTSTEAEPENTTNIQAEPNTNALIITAPPSLMKSLKAIVTKLDIRPAQVSVEAIIVEIDQDDLNNLGIQWGARTPLNSTGVLIPASLGFPQLGEGTLGIIPGSQFQAVLSILQQSHSVNILSTPSIVVLDNQKAVLKVGKEVPQQTGSYATSGSANTATPFNTIANIPVVLELDVTPQINLSNAVRLKVTLRNDTLQNPDVPTLTPTINTSQIDNSVIVNSEDVLVIGGLISNNLTESVDKIPFLSDIPGVGLLFQHKIHKVEKKNLVAFIRPVILYTSNDASRITNTKYNEARQSQIDFPQDLSQGGQQKAENTLPLWKNNVELPKPFAE